MLKDVKQIPPGQKNKKVKPELFHHESGIGRHTWLKILFGSLRLLVRLPPSGVAFVARERILSRLTLKDCATIQVDFSQSGHRKKAAKQNY